MQLARDNVAYSRIHHGNEDVDHHNGHDEQVDHEQSLSESLVVRARELLIIVVPHHGAKHRHECFKVAVIGEYSVAADGAVVLIVLVEQLLGPNVFPDKVEDLRGTIAIYREGCEACQPCENDTMNIEEMIAKATHYFRGNSKEVTNRIGSYLRQSC